MNQPLIAFIKHEWSRIKKITPLQASIILIAVVIIVSVVKLFGTQPQSRIIKVQVIGKSWTDSFQNNVGYRPPIWLIENISVGSKEMDISGSVLAEVIDLETYSTSNNSFDTYLTLKINGTLDSNTNTFIYNARPVQVGSPVQLRLNNSLIQAQVIDDDVPAGGYKTKKFIINVRARGLEPWVLAELNIGDTLTKGMNKTVIAEILNIKEEPFQSQLLIPKQQILDRSNYSLISDPRLTDAVFTLRVDSEQHQLFWYFAGFQQLKVGNLLNLSFPSANLFNLEIQSIEIDEKL